MVKLKNYFMNNIIHEHFTNGSKASFLYVISIFSIFMGIYVIISKNPILSVLFLIGLFSGISIYLIMIGLHFLGLSYLLVYIGAISILFLFILMLINVRISELLTDNNNSIPLAILTVLCFNYSVYDVLPYSLYMFDLIGNYVVYSIKDLLNTMSSIKTITPSDNITNILYDYLSYINIASVKSRSWDNILLESSHISSIGNILYTNQYILFIIASLILLLAMVGAIIITINKTVTSKKIYNY